VTLPKGYTKVGEVAKVYTKRGEVAEGLYEERGEVAEGIYVHTWKRLPKGYKVVKS
jgi:hypothetical protein